MSATDDYPTHCRNGHALGPGQGLHGWEQCGCPTSENNGHRWHECNTCEDLQWTPPCQDWPIAETRGQRFVRLNPEAAKMKTWPLLEK
jgi:hypothetical protein